MVGKPSKKGMCGASVKSNSNGVDAAIANAQNVPFMSGRHMCPQSTRHQTNRNSVKQHNCSTNPLNASYNSKTGMVPQGVGLN